MTTKTVRASGATFVREGSPSTNYFGAAKEHLRVDSGTAYTFAYFPSPAPAGSTVESAVIEFTAEATWTGSRTMTVRRLDPAPRKNFNQTTWTNQPAIDAASTAVPVTQAGTILLWQFDVTADYQAFASGLKNNGFRLTTSDTTARNVFGFQARTGFPRLVLTYSTLPAVPTNLSPSGGAVSVAKPQLTFTLPADTSAIQVQIDPDADFTVAAWDSGEVTTGLGQLILTATSYPGLALAATTSWRVRAKNALGWSEWSDVHSFSRVAKTTVTITNPGATSGDNTPPVTWTAVGQTGWQVTTTVAAKVVDDSGVQGGTDTSYTPAAGPKQTGDVAVTKVLVTDAVDRVATAGDPVEATDSQTWTLTFDATVPPALTLTAVKDVVLPSVLLTWTRATPPDEWAVVRDGDIVARFDGPDALLSGTTYTFTDWSAEPNQEHTYRVAAVVNGEMASTGPTATLTPTVDGIWLIDNAGDRWFTLGDPSSLSLSKGESSTVYVPLTAAASLVRRFGVRGLEGGVTGRLETYGDRTWDAMAADIEGMRRESALLCRLVLGDVNIPVSVTGLSDVVDAEDAYTDDMRKVVSFTVYEQPETIAGL